MIELIREYLKGDMNMSESLISSKANEDFNYKYRPSSIDNLDERFSGSFVPGKIYVFDYFTDTEISKKNSFINYNPTSIFCETSKVNNEYVDFFIDLNVIPLEYRKVIFDRLYSSYRLDIESNIKNIGNQQKPLDTRYRTIKGLLSGTGFEFAYTGFKRANIRNIKVVNYKDWPMSIFMTENKIKGDSINEIYRKYRARMNS